MSSHARSSREEERTLSIRTLVIASAASALAAIVTSRFWTAGTPVAAALTPVFVTLISELLHRPTQRIAERFTTEGAPLPRRTADAMPETDALPEAAGAGPPPREEEDHPRPAREPPARGLAAGEPEFRTYRTSPTRRVPWKPILVTAAIAFVVGMAALTLPELIAGQSFGSGDRSTTLFGGGKDEHKEESPAEKEQTEPGKTAPDVDPDQPGPQTQPQPEQTAPALPESTTPSPKSPTPTPQGPVPQVPPLP